MAVIPIRIWGTILVIGGTGRLGYFVIQELLRQAECGHVVSINRRPNVDNQHEGVEYRALDVRDTDSLRQLLLETKPEIIINTAAPSHAGSHTAATAAEMKQTIVDAQDVLIGLARQGSVKVLISTTSANVAAGTEHINIDETAELWPEDSKAFPYWVQRAQAERRLLAADGRDLQTCSLRLPLIIGERDYAFVPAMLNFMEQGKTSIQIGDNTSKLATISAEDAARGHAFALRTLLQQDNKAHGEAFYITGARPLPFWTLARIVWAAAGWQESKSPWIIPYWFMWTVALLAEWLVYLTSSGQQEPELTRHAIQFMGNTFTYNGGKSQRVLGFVPKDDVDDQLRKSVVWQLQKKQA